MFFNTNFLKKYFLTSRAGSAQSPRSNCLPAPVQLTRLWLSFVAETITNIVETPVKNKASLVYLLTSLTFRLARKFKGS